MSSNNLVRDFIANPPVQDIALVCLTVVALCYGGKFALAPTVDLKPISVNTANIKITVGNKVANLLLPKGECRVDENGDYILILDESPKVEIEGKTIMSNLPTRSTGQFPNFLTKRFAGPSYNFGGLSGICDGYKYQLLGFITNAVSTQINSK